MAKPRSKKKRLRGPQPRTTCDYCGRQLSMHAMKRHIGTAKCTTTYWRRKLSDDFPRPPGHQSIYGNELDISHELVRAAGFTPETSPVFRAVVWNPGSAEPNLQWLAPAWLETCLVVARIRMFERIAAENQYGYSNPPETAKLKKAMDVLIAAYDVLKQDLVTLLQYMATNADDRIALSTELNLVSAITDEDGHEDFDVHAAENVIRRWASEVATKL